MIEPIKTVSVIMGSQSDWSTMMLATEPLKLLEIPYTTHVISAHRTPDRLYEFARNAHHHGIEVIIAGAGGSAHLAGMAAAMTHLPVIAVPVQSRHLQGLDSLLSMVQMPKGVAVATQAIGEPGAFNAGLLAAQILALEDEHLRKRLINWRNKQSASVPNEVE